MNNTNWQSIINSADINKSMIDNKIDINKLKMTKNKGTFDTLLLLNKIITTTTIYYNSVMFSQQYQCHFSRSK